MVTAFMEETISNILCIKLLDIFVTSIIARVITFRCAIDFVQKLVELLRDNSLNHLSLPVLSLASTITEVISQSSSWNQLIIVKQVGLHFEKNKSTLSTCHEKRPISTQSFW